MMNYQGRRHRKSNKQEVIWSHALVPQSLRNKIKAYIHNISSRFHCTKTPTKKVTWFFTDPPQYCNQGCLDKGCVSLLKSEIRSKIWITGLFQGRCLTGAWDLPRATKISNKEPAWAPITYDSLANFKHTNNDKISCSFCTCETKT